MVARRKMTSGRILVGACAAVLASARLAAAGSFTWNGLGIDDNWTSGGNWVGGIAPGAGDSVIFDGTNRVTPFNNNPAGTSFAGLSILSTAGNFSLGGNGMTLGGDILDNAVGTQSINMPLILSATRTIGVTAVGNALAGGNLTINGVISDGGAGFGLNIINSNINRIGTSGGAAVGSYGLGLVTLTGANTYTGTTAVQTGRLLVDFTAPGAAVNNIISNSSALTLGAAGSPTTTPGIGILNMNGGSGVTNSQGFNGTTIGNGANQVNVTSGGLAANLNLGAITRNSHGTVTFTLPTAGAISASSSLENGILGGWATVGSDYATISGGNVVAYTGYTPIVGNVTVTNATAPAGSNIKWTGYTATAPLPQIGVAATTTDIESINMADNTATVVTINGILRLGAHGGILRPGAGTANIQFSGGTLTAGGAANTVGEITFNNTQTGVNNSNDLQINSVIANNGTGLVTVVKNGPGSLVLNAVNTFTGDTYVNQGRVSMNNASAFGPAGSKIYIQPGGHVFFNTSPISYNYFIAGLGSRENLGDFGAIRMNNNQTMAGTITLTGDARIGSNGGNATITAQITGDHNIEFLGVNNVNGLTLNNTANNWTGGTTINRGTLGLGNNEVIPDGSDVTIGTAGNGGTALGILNLNGKTETIARLLTTDPSNTFVQNNLVNTTGTLAVGASNASWDYSGALRDNAGTGGKLALAKVGTGTLTLSGNNSLTGGIIVNNGVLRAGSFGALNGLGGNVVSFGAAAPVGTTLRLNGFSAIVAGLSTNATVGSPVVENANATPATLTISGTGSNTYGGAIQDGPGGGALSLTKAGTGTQTLEGANTYTGDTTVTAGTLRVTGSISSAGNIIVNSGGVLSVIGTVSNANNTTVNFGGALSGTGSAGNINMQFGSSIRPGATAADGSIGTLSMNMLAVGGGDFRVDLSPGGSDRVVVAGLADFGGGSTITPAIAAAPGTYTVLTAGELTGIAPTINTPSSNTRATYTVDFDTAAKRIQVVITGAAKSLTWSGTGTPGDVWDVNTTANWKDGAIAEKFFDLDTVTFNDSGINRTISINGSVAPASITVNNSAGNDYAFNGGTISDSLLAGGTSLTKSGAGKLTLNTFLNYAGATTIKNGTLVLAGSGLPFSSNLTMGDEVDNTSAVIDLGGTNLNVASLATVGTGTANVIGSSSTNNGSSITIAGGSTVFNGSIQDSIGAGNQSISLTLNSGSLTVVGNASYSGSTTIGSGATFQVGVGGASIFGGGSVQDDGFLIFNSTASFSVGAITGSGLLRHLGSGTVTLTGDNFYSGTTTIGSGTLRVGNGGALGTLGGGTVTNDGTLAFNRSGALTVGNLIVGTGQLSVNGGVTLTLSAANTYSGVSNITGSTVVVTNAAGTTSSLGAIPTAAGGDVIVGIGGSVNLGGGAGNNALNFGQKVFHIAGDGGGMGALTNRSAATADGSIGGNTQQNAFQRVILDADASIGSSGRTMDDPDGGNSLGRIDIRVGTFGTAGILNLNGHNLTKIGSSFLGLVNIDVQGTGNITVNGGNLNLEANTHVLNDGSSKIIIKDGAMLQFWNPAAAGATNLTRQVEMGDGTATSNSSIAAGGGGGTVGMPIVLKGDLITKPTYGNFNNSDLVLAGNITQDATPRKLIKANLGALTLSGTNSFTGGIDIVTGTRANPGVAGVGAVVLGGANALDPANVISIATASGYTGTFRLNGFNAAVAGLESPAISGPALVENGGAGTVTLTINNSAGHSFSGVLQNGAAGTLALTKSGAGRQSLSGASTYSGGTLISGGTLAVNNTFGSGTGSGDVTVAAGGTLAGGGLISGNVNVQSGGHVAPGNSVGILTLGGLTLDGALLNMEGDLSGFDRINLTGTDTLNLATASTVGLSDLGGVTEGDFVLIDYNGTPLSSISNLSLTSNTLGSYSVSLFHDSADTSIKLHVGGDVTPQWNVDAGGDWGEAGNWAGGVPGGVAGVANFLGKISTAQAVTLDGDRTVGTVNFNNANSYSIAPGTGGVLHLGDATHDGTISVANGAQQISAQVAVDGTTDVNIVAEKSLEMSGAVSIAAGKTLRKNGGGTLTISGAQSAGAGAIISVLEGTLNLNSNAGGDAKPSLTIGLENANATVVLGADQDFSELNVAFGLPGNQSLDLKSGPGATEFHSVRVFAADLAATRSSLWEAIKSANSPTAINPLDGIIDGGLHSGAGIGIALIDDHILIRPTRAGDLNLDGSVTIADFIALASHFNQAGTWQEGDINYDGSVTIADFIALASNFNQAYAGGSGTISSDDRQLLASFASGIGADPSVIGSAVPEPGVMGLMAAGAMMVGRRRRK